MSESSTPVNPTLNAMSKRFVFTNISAFRLMLNPVHSSAGEPIGLAPGEEVSLTGAEFSSVYAHSIKVFRDCTPVKLTMREEGQAPLSASPATGSEPTGSDQTNAQGEADLLVTRDAQVLEIRKAIKDLEEEYRSGKSGSERKQDIKEEIRDLKKILKDLK